MARPKPGASSGSPTRVQGPKALGRPQLLSQATGRELEGKRDCRDYNRCPYEIPVVQGEDLTTCATAQGPISQELYFFLRFIFIIFYWKGRYTEKRDREEDLPSDDSLPK